MMLFPHSTLLRETLSLSCPCHCYVGIVLSGFPVVADLDIPVPLSLAVNGLVLRVCEIQENSPCFQLSSLSLTKEHLTPLLRALKLQTTVRQLCLSANRLGDDAMEELVACLVTMPNLSVLDISSNQITHQGLRTLCETSRVSQDAPFQ
eukprot:g33103.t1